MPIALVCVLPSLVGESPEITTDTPPIKDWPTSPRPKSEVFHMEVSEDGPPQKRMVFDCGRFALITGNYGKWEEQTSSARYSFQLSPKSDSDITFGMARFPNNDFIESLNEKDWAPYIESLKSHPIPKIVQDQRFSIERKAAPVVLNERPYRVVDYQYTDSKGNLIRTWELFTFLEGELFVFGLSGHTNKVALYQERVNLMISRMNVLN